MSHTSSVLNSLLLILLFASPVTGDSSLVGEYYQGDGTGVNWTLKLLGDHEFSFTWTGCLGTYGEANGTWQVRGYTLSLKPRETRDMAERLPLDYDMVMWPPRVYLIPRKDIPLFCMYVNQGWEPRNEMHGLFFIRTETAELNLNGKPTLPSEFKKYLLDKPVRTRILKATGCWASVNAGTSEGLVPGMLVAVYRSPSVSEKARVVSATMHYAVIECVDGEELRFGAAVSTLLYDEVIERELGRSGGRPNSR